MTPILIIDTTLPILSIALIVNEATCDQFIANEGFQHAKSITIEIDNLLRKNKIEYYDLSAVALNEGPGSFTGLRVGSSVAKGICFALNIPLIAMKGIEVYARYFSTLWKDTYTDIFILVDARRDNYFYTHIQGEQVIQEISFGSLAEINDKIKSTINPWILFSNKENETKLTANLLIDEVIKKYKNKEFKDIAFFEPNYFINNYQK